MGKKATRNTEKKTPAIKDLPTATKQASDVKGGAGSLITATTTGTHIKDGQITT